MALILREIFNIHDYAIEQWADPRVSDWFLMGSLWPVLGIVAAYLYFVLSLGPQLMENRKPLNINNILIAYNAIQVIYCAVMFVVATIYLMPYYNIFCEPCDFSMSPRGVLAAKLTWFYFILKIIDLLDTVFFVLRKKNNQISFLHVYHHAGMVTLAWIGARYVPGGASIYFGYANIITHAAMYGYYLLTVWNKNYKNSFWWKKHITHMQIIQFGFHVLLFTVIIAQDSCTFPKLICMFMIPQNLFMFVLFGDFYLRNYVSPSRDVMKSKTD